MLIRLTYVICHRGRNRQPGNVALQARDFLRRSDLHTALHSGQAAERCPLPGQLAAVLLESTFENAHQRAGTELIGDRGNILQTLRLAKGPQESSTLQAGAAQQVPFRQDDCPGNQTESEQGEKYELGDGAGTGNQIKYFAADKKCRVWEEWHLFFFGCDL